MDHLACFAPAMLAFGAQDGHKHDAQYMALAARICETCMAMYTRTRTGLAPEYVTFSKVSPNPIPIPNPNPNPNPTLALTLALTLPLALSLTFS